MNQIVRRNTLEPSTLSEAIHFSQMLAKSTMVPRDFQNRPENILVALQWGREIGLGPLQALQNIAVINGRPSVWGDAMLALVRGSASCGYVRESLEGDGDEMKATCRARRAGETEDIVGEFSVDDAKRAGLWDKAGPWKQYPKRMLQMRARGFCLRDAFPDILKGVISAEEARDTPVDDFKGTTIDAEPAKPGTVFYPPPKTAAEEIGDGLPDHSAPHPLDEPNGTKWLKNLRNLLGACVTEEQVVEIAGHSSVEQALKTAPGRFKALIQDYLTDAYAKFKTSEQDADESEPPTEVDDFLHKLKRMSPTEIERLDQNAEHRAWIKSLAEADYKRVADGVADRVMARAGA